ncbi:hypothetical protein ZOSMA_18G00630 [Zostera marina]|uniref:Aminotransferase class I/classII large domain-containing protein n=1 Tax=Zostera marina TaxID=29655 RepID=A0A0K9PPG0_ZOSMR|nr:hypothetical protein ZOSMA_18G00630 [Zostera marina]
MAPTTQIDSSLKNGYQSNGKVKNNNSCSVIKCNATLAEQKISIRGLVGKLLSSPNPDKEILSLGVGDASAFAAFREGRDVSRCIMESVNSGTFHGYPPAHGFPFVRRAVADYLSWGVSQKFNEKDVFMTVGGTQAIQVILTVLANQGCNVLLPRPGFPPYEATCEINHIEPRYYDLLPNSNWEVDLDQVRNLTDSKTVGIVVINPNNPCGAVYSRSHLTKIAETAAELNLPLIADEIYGHMVFREAKFVPMASLCSIVPVLTLGALSKRWLVPGWRCGWVAISDRNGALSQVRMAMERLMNVTSGPASIIQAALPGLLSDSNDEFHSNVVKLLESSEEALFHMIQKIPALICHSRPQGSMFMMVQLDYSLLKGIGDDMEFASKLMKEESVLILPGTVIGLENWIRIFFGTPPDLLKEAMGRIMSFCSRYA